MEKELFVVEFLRREKLILRLFGKVGGRERDRYIVLLYCIYETEKDKLTLI